MMVVVSPGWGLVLLQTADRIGNAQRSWEGGGEAWLSEVEESAGEEVVRPTCECLCTESLIITNKESE